ncbi:DUF5134 domain-containing protein [Sinomonas flava]|uniref:DUF5134 domain-containing protein n=1 Tax=Sinomonas flava TaxID=496857 RepID=UPI0039A55DE7
MMNFPAITWTLTIILALVGAYHLIRGIRSDHVTGRVNSLLHALMGLIMAGMLWNLAPSTTLAQIVVLSGAALWFVIQALARPEFERLCAGRGGRLKCAYHGLTMAGGAIMVAMMTGYAAPAAAGAVTAAEVPAAHAHHSTGSAAHASSLTASGSTSTPAILLALFFSAASVVFMFAAVRARHAASRQHSGRLEHGLESAGAGAMALMFATMST